ncbi:MAG: autotransporter outer membrane beta-barrel domain-containing protein, partial [Selenomonadales bacterium]|nr:autotransporter outer membrane beta-barrel domain-containing protein [Selenomonadales bacterium]
MDKTTLNVDKSEIAGGPWLGNIGSAVSASGVGTKTVIDLNGNDFEVNATHSSNHSTGITAINDGIVEINNPGDITVTATGGDQTAALFANGSGEIHIHNGEGGTVIARADAASAPNGAVIKTMNGKAGESKIIIDGMVDVVADKNEGSNEAISAVASRIEIGGGNIEAKNGAAAAIRAYGEFTTQNAGIVNVNVTKDADGNITGAGDRKTTIKGDFVTNGGMGSKGQISVGLKGEESFWEGKYTDNVGYGVTPGQLGSVNLWIEDGAHWTGYSSGSVNLSLSGDGSYWDGYSTSNKMLLSLKNGATWKNSNASQTSLIGNFIGDGGSIDMTGGVTIDKYSGNTMVLYKHEVTAPVMTLADDDTTNTETTPQVNIIGGDITIKSAAEDSAITLRTDSDGIDLQDREMVEGTLDKLANKLYYTGYVDGERNLTGSVEIAEGLTTSSVKKVYGNIGYSETDGQGSLDGQAEGLIPEKQVQDTFTTPIRGLNEEVYINAGVLKDGVYEFTMDKTTLNVDKSMIAGGPWLGNIGSAVSASGVGTKTVIDLNGNDFEVNATH